MLAKDESQALNPQSHHVVPQPSGEWSVRDNQITKIFPTQREAMDYAREITRQQGTQLVIQGFRGEILSIQPPGADQDRPESGFGCAQGLIVIPPEFDAPLEEFDEILQ